MDNILIRLFARMASLPEEWSFAIMGILEEIRKEECVSPTVLCGEEEELHHLGEATAALYAVTKNPVFEKFAKGMESPASLLGSELKELVDAIVDDYLLIAKDTYTYRALLDICKIRLRKTQMIK